MASFPSDYPSFVPSVLFGTAGSIMPTVEVIQARQSPIEAITFFAVGDAPYTKDQANKFAIQMQNIPDNADFIIHVGDIRNGSASTRCRQSQYQDVANILKLSPVPVFIVLGDNDWPDCGSPSSAYGYWKGQFLNFESKHWSHNFDISHQSDVEENFSFVYKGSLFIGVNMVGYDVLGKTAWNKRMASQANWVIENVRDYRQNSMPGTERVFLFGHAEPRSKHQVFFNPLKDFMQNELDDSVPFLYLHGHGHKWRYAPNFLNLNSFLEIMVTGETNEPPLKFVIDTTSTNLFPNTQKAFPYYRDLQNSTRWNTLN